MKGWKPLPNEHSKLGGGGCHKLVKTISSIYKVVKTIRIDTDEDERWKM